MTTLAFVPVRGGSRSIPGKNVRSLCGRPLVYWCLEALQHASRIDRVVVATDCPEIEEVVLSFGFSKVGLYRRDPANAGDLASTESVVLEYLERIEAADRDTFVLVQATSPLLRSRDLDEALDRLEASGADSLLSCVRSKRFFWDEDGRPLNYDPRRRPRRQDFSGLLMENGAFYANSVGGIRRDACRLSGRVLVHELPAFAGIELDEEDDWVVADALMRRHLLSRRTPAAPIRLVLTDVDGVLTDAGMYYSERGDELKKFNTLDGKAFELLRRHGIRTGIVTAEDTQIVQRRASKIRADHLHQGVKDKRTLVQDLCRREGIDLSHVAYLGDDLGDVELLEAVGFSACPSSAMTAVKRVSQYICRAAGGEGCLREVADLILEGS